MNYKSVTILMADDDPDDRMLAQDALKEARLGNHMNFVEDGQALMDLSLIHISEPTRRS